MRYGEHAKGGKAEEFSGTEVVVLAGVLSVLFLFATVTAAREVWSVELGGWITVRMLLRKHHYNRRALREWGFQAEGGGLTRNPFSGAGILHLRFDDGRSFAVAVDGRLSGPIIASLTGAPAVLTGAPAVAREPR